MTAFAPFIVVSEEIQWRIGLLAKRRRGLS